jgi:hypothetical protein
VSTGSRHVPIAITRTPRVSVVVPCYNYGRFLRDCVESVLAQTGVIVDVLIVDDASQDETPEICVSLAAGDARVTVIRHETNQGHIATFNEGLWAVDGEYVVKLDADDMIPPGALARGSALLDAHPSVGLAYGRPVHFTGERPRPVRTRVKDWTVWPGAEWLALRCQLGFNCISNPEVMVRTSVLRSVGPNRPELEKTFDMEMWMRIAAVADIGRVNGSDQGWYRVHGASFQRTIHAGPMIDLEGRRDAFDWVFRGPGANLLDAERLHAQARGALAAEAIDRACRAYDRGRTAEVPVAELIAFALSVYPEVVALPQWRALRRRQRVGAELARLAPPFVARAFIRRASEEIYGRRWLRTGV